MTDIILFCPEPPSLKLGPSEIPSECIAFKDGFARFDSEAFPDWEKWVKHPGTPYIEILPPDTAQVPAGPSTFECPVCGKAFAKEFARTGHLRSHAPKG
jgi:hypothetical protein